MKAKRLTCKDVNEQRCHHFAKLTICETNGAMASLTSVLVQHKNCVEGPEF